MIQQIINTIRETAEKNVYINSFGYGDLWKRQNTGEKNYPCLWLESPIRKTNGGITDPVVKYVINFDVLLLQHGNRDLQADIHTIAERIAQSVLLRLKDNYKKRLNTIDVLSYDIVTLSEYNDDKAGGVRVTATLQTPADLNFCTMEDFFDEEKQFPEEITIPKVDVENAEDCEGKKLKFKTPKI